MVSESRAGGARAAAIRDTLTLYLRRRVLVVLLLGFSSGLPLLLSFSTLSTWMREVGVDLTSIGLFSLVGLPYTVKFLWAPAMDRLALPPLTGLLGRRRGWMLATQVMLIATLVGLGTTNPIASPLMMALFGVLVAFFSASQDIVIDAYRIESLEETEQGAGAAAYVLGYRVGILAAGAGALLLADSFGWFHAYLAMAALMLVGLATVLLSPEPPAPALPAFAGEGSAEKAAAWFRDAVVAPFAEFLARPWALLTLLFILLYKLGDAFLGAMTNPFYIDVGFSKTEIAEVTKVFGLFALLGGLVVGGIMVRRLGLMWALLICGVLQAASNLVFAAQAAVGHEVWMLVITIGVENATGGMGTAAFIAYLSQLTNVAFTATQYALLSSFMAFGRTVLSSPSGWVAEQLGWVPFFVASTAIAVPGLALLVVLMRLFPPSPVAKKPAEEPA
ncbi:MFS transporter [Thalassobaculum fulvum]|uniref:MFS transporter n=1 Tax=Thalassobaculum fulvum TaxID=1633335 RepID=A0A919CMI5_9PROT|nr:AmpG family muropeptide MFS transporter [Thalassobaculum fulvum]GHD39848.1 MFS transporter [Thalassobaculum fulvum]